MSQTKPLTPFLKTSLSKQKLALVLSRRPWLFDLGALLFFTVLTLIFLIPLTGSLAESAVNEGDDLQQMWSMGWVIHALTTGPANLFNANIFYPYPNTLAFSDHLIGQSLFSLPVVLLTGNLVLGYNFSLILSFILSGWGCYLLVKAITGNRLAGLFAGLIFAYAPYKVGHLSQLNLLSTQWIPFCFLFFRKILTLDQKQKAWRHGWGPVFLFALFFVLNSLSSTYYLFFILPLLGIYFVLYHLFSWRWPSPKVLIHLGVALGLSFIVLWPSFIPYLQLSLEQSAERTPREVEQFSANYRFYFGVPEENFFWGKILFKYGGLGGERKLFPGALALLFGFLALGGPFLAKWLSRRKKSFTTQKENSSSLNYEPYIFLAIGIFSLLMSFGLVLHLKGLEVPMPYRFFYDYFPGWKGLRAAMRFGLFVLLATAVLAGLGVAFIWPLLKTWFISRKVTPLAPAVLGILLLFGTFGEYRSDLTRINPGILPNPPQVYRWLGEPSNRGTVLELPMPNPGALPSIRDYYSTFNWQPMVGGESGYLPPVYNDLFALSQDLAKPESLAIFQGLGVRWLVYHLADENTPLKPEEWARIEAKLNTNKSVKLAKTFEADHIKVFELAPDPWMKDLVDSLPAGVDLISSDFRREQPTSIELIETLLRRNGHNLYGSDRAGYRFLSPPPSGRPVLFGLFSSNEDPRPAGFLPDEVLWQGHNLKLSQRKVKPFSAYDLNRDPALTEFSQINKPLEIEINDEGLKFNGKSPGSGEKPTGKLELNLQVSSLVEQAVKVKYGGEEKTLQTSSGLSTWRLGPLKLEDKITIEASSAGKLFLGRAEVLPWTEGSPASTKIPDGTLVAASNQRQGNHIRSTFDFFLPKRGEGASDYLASLDLYKRPWGTHPSGHFGVWSVALQGSEISQQVIFDFDPISKTTRVTLNGKNLEVGTDVIRPGDGDWAAFLALRGAGAKNPKNLELLGIAPLFDFNLNGMDLRDLNLNPPRQFVFLPPLK